MGWRSLFCCFSSCSKEGNKLNSPGFGSANSFEVSPCPAAPLTPLNPHPVSTIVAAPATPAVPPTVHISFGVPSVDTTSPAAPVVTISFGASSSAAHALPGSSTPIDCE